MRGLLWLIGLVLVLVLVLATVFWMAGCAQPAAYQTVPHWLIPVQPIVPTVRAGALSCLTDETYTALVERDRACWQYARELRALLGPDAP